jgi:hypothetical protein
MKAMLVAAAILVGASGTAAAAPPADGIRATSVDAPAFERWRAAIRHLPRPKRGCFTATYPQTAWLEMPCQDAPQLPHRPARGNRAGGDTVGSGSTDGDILATAAAIGEAEGTFLSVTTTGESDSVTGADAYSLQLNANTFNTTRCQDAPSGTGANGCYGWEQFVYDSGGSVYIQYWLVQWGPKGATCPTQSPKCDGKYVYTDGWCPFELYGSTDCAIGSPSGTVPVFAPADLAQVSLTANAAGTHGNLLDGVMLTQPGAAAVSVAGWNEFPDLSSNWQQAEFNIFGAGNGSAANFNAGSTLVIQLSTDTGSQARPGCTYDSLTGETNNLSIVETSFAATDSLYPSLVFTESNATGTVPISNCNGTLSLPGGSTDSYAPGSRQLTIPSLQIGWATYSDVVVTVGSIVTPPSGTSANGAVDTYDPQTGLLTVQAVSVGAQTYYNVTVTINALLSIGAVAGADWYDGYYLHVPQIQAAGTDYGDVLVTVRSVVRVGGRMPAAASDTYVASSDELSIPAVQSGTAVFTNVVIKVGTIESVGTSETAP